MGGGRPGGGGAACALTAPVPAPDGAAELPQCIVSLETAMEALGHLPPSSERQVRAGCGLLRSDVEGKPWVCMPRWRLARTTSGFWDCRSALPAPGAPAISCQHSNLGFLQPAGENGKTILHNFLAPVVRSESPLASAPNDFSVQSGVVGWVPRVRSSQALRVFWTALWLDIRRVSGRKWTS